ncbi:MAG: hypothetical protein C0506_09125 [Anaerolinea sp.]|nr:hypothetical protein [Anaerolinea sp.]
MPSLRRFNFSDMKIANRLAIFVVVLGLPVCVLLFAQYRAAQEQIDFAEAESDGMTYVAALIPFMTDVQNHRALALAVLNGDATGIAALEKSAADGDASLAALQAVDGRFGERFKTGDALARIREQWGASRDTPASLSPETSADVHSTLIRESVLPLLRTVVTNSRLAVDPDVATRSLIAALTESMPGMNEALSDARGYSAAVLLQRKGFGARDDQKLYLTARLAVVKAEGETMIRSLETAMAANPTFEASLRPTLSRTTTARESFESVVKGYIIESATVGNPSVFTLGGRATELSSALLTESRTGLEKEFNSRADAARMDLYSQGGIALGGIVVALLMAIVVSRTITRPISHLAEVADRMSLGELDVEIDVNGNNEVGQLAESLRRMQASLRSAIERLRQRRQNAA